MTIKKINSDLNKKIRNVKLSQVIRMVIASLKFYYPEKSEKSLYNQIIFKANPSLSFQKSDVSSIFFIEKEEKIFVEITLNFLSIFGSQSPMPTHYSELVLKSAESDAILYDFLNLFNHHLQRFVYPIWEKHRYYVQFRKDLNDTFSRYIMSFLGLRMNFVDKESKINITRLLCYSGLLNMRFQSANNIKSILRYYLAHEDLEMIEFIPEKYNIPSWQKSKLGLDNSYLGKNILIGDCIIGRNNKFHIVLRNSKFEDLKRYSFLSEDIYEFEELIAFVIQEPLSYELIMHVKKEEQKDFILQSNSDFHLGINCWIGEKMRDEEVIAIRKVGEQIENRIKRFNK